MSTPTAVEHEVKFGYLPALRGDRQFGFWDFLAVQIGFGIAAWCFLVGGYTGSVLAAGPSVGAILFGNAIPVFLIAPLALLYARYGVDTFIGARAGLGYNGSNLFFIVFAVLNLGWITIATFMLGESVIRLLVATGAEGAMTTREVGAPIFAIAAFILAWYVAYKGPLAIRWFIRIGVPSMLIILAGLIVAVLGVHGLDKVFGAAPSEPYDTFTRSVVTAVEWNVGLGFSWLPYIGQWARLARDEKTAYMGTYFGWGVILNLAGVFGAFTAILVGSLDPTDWMIGVGGVAFGALGLVFLILANLTSATVLIYSQALSMKTVFPRGRWVGVCLSTVPAALLMLTPAMYDAYGTFLTYISFIMSAYGGVLVVDFLVVRRQQIHLPSLYDTRQGVYRYAGGFNIPAHVAIVAAGIFYFWTYNPVADVSGPLFETITAGIPTFFISGILYWALARMMGQGVPAKEKAVA